jgi:hypothetical protein
VNSHHFGTGSGEADVVRTSAYLEVNAMSRQLGPFAVTCVLLLLVTGCVPLPPGQPTAPTLSALRPQATPVPYLLHPPSERTGIAEVDRVIDAMLSPDRDAVTRMVHFLTTPCTTREGLGGPPKCGPAETDGTPVEVFPVGGPEGTFMGRAEIDHLVPSQVAGLYAVYRVPANAYREAYWPAGNYGVVFLRPDSSFVIALVDESGIVRLDYPPPPSGDGTNGWMSEEMILPPRNP